MPMNLECVAAYLGIVRARLRVVSIADSFPPNEVRDSYWLLSLGFGSGLCGERSRSSHCKPLGMSVHIHSST